ncbi:ATPase [Podospora fimiseda]|uniref:ATPase n=1 Tax=Podospora fimiseda TaxID=252190 RepID=A0AAN7BQN0_9PEZI|nr:ATPase [Podospora fimiseda]
MQTPTTMERSNSTSDSGIDIDMASSPQKRGPWVRYRTEWRHRTTDELLDRKDTNGYRNHSDENPDQTGMEPVFELITTYRTRVLENAGSSSSGPPVLVTTMLSKPEYHLNIYSPAIANALHSVVKYYPTQSLSGDPIVVRWPYPILVHHYDELAAFKDAAAKKDPADLCIMEKDAPKHISLLLEFLDKHVMDDVRAEQARLKKGTYTWEHMWVGYKPGVTTIEKYLGDTEWTVRVVHGVTGGSFETDSIVPWIITGWYMTFNGKEIGREYHTLEGLKFDGESSSKVYFLEHHEFDEDKLDELPEPAKDRIKHGETWFNLLSKQTKYHKGKTRDFPYNEVEGLVMVDMEGYFMNREGYNPPNLVGSSDCRPALADGTCAYCKGHARTRVNSESGGGVKTNSGIVALYQNYNDITLEDFDELTPHQYLLCPIDIQAFVFKTRKWERLFVWNFSEPQWDEGMIDGLVMDPARKKTLMSLSKSFARRNKHGEKMEKSMWSADFVRGKGSGLIFLLHGRPGVGKTCTAECIAAFTRRPLMVLTSSDIGTKPSEVETNLTKMFKTAMSWDAVLLIDEADVFMERRTTADLERNSLVAGFLRALEFYDGILFLTTNRVGAFDDAFISRVHVQLYFPEFTNEQRQLVWKTFVDKLARERGNYIRLNLDAKDYIRGAEMRAVEWNGREIRNALQTAVAMAEYDAEKDEEGKILVTDTHLRAVVELSRDFKNYLNDLHRGSEAKRAERRQERLERDVSIR